MLTSVSPFSFFMSIVIILCIISIAVRWSIYMRDDRLAQIRYSNSISEIQRLPPSMHTPIPKNLLVSSSYRTVPAYTALAAIFFSFFVLATLKEPVLGYKPQPRLEVYDPNDTRPLPPNAPTTPQ